MASRAEIIDEAVLLLAGAESVLWTLGLSGIPLRRAQITALSGLSNQVVLKALARLANLSVLAPTEGLVFEITPPELAADIRARITAGEEKRLREAFLAFAEGHPGFSADFRVAQLMGLGRFREAAALVLEIAALASKPLPADRLSNAFRAVLAGLAGEDERDLVLEEDLTLAWLEGPLEVLRPRELKLAAETMAAAGLVNEKKERLDRILPRVEAEFAARAARRRFEKAQSTAAAAATSGEAAESEAEA